MGIVSLYKMSLTITLTGTQSVLSTDFFPPIQLSADYVVGLIDFQTFNSIPNIDESNNKFYYGKDQVITIPIGSYEIQALNSYLRRKLEDPRVAREAGFDNDIKKDGKPIYFNLTPNNNTLKSEIKSTVEIDFEPDDCIGSLLGFTKRILEPNVLHASDEPVNILKVNGILVECNIVSGAFTNDKPTHTLHEFFPTVPPGYKILEIPRNVIYLPISVRTINNITLKIVDQENRLVNFRSETIIVRLHLKPKHGTLL